MTTCEVQIAFGIDPFDDTSLDTDSNWVTVTDFVRQVDYQTDSRSDRFAVFSAGRATIILDNRNRHFDPDHTGGPFVGDLKRNVPVRVTGIDAGTRYVVWYGYALEWQPVYDFPNDSVTRLRAQTALGALSQYELAPLSSASYGGDSAGARIGRVLDDWGFPSAYRDLDSGYTMQSTTWGVNALAHCQQVAIAAGGLFYTQRDGTLTFDEFSALTTTRQTTSQDTFGHNAEPTPLNRPGPVMATAGTGYRDLVRIAPTGGDTQTIDNSGANEAPVAWQRTNLPLASETNAAALADFYADLFGTEKPHPRELTFQADASAQDAAASILRDAVLYVHPGGGRHPYDVNGYRVLERGDTQDGGYLAPCDPVVKGIGLHQPYQGTLKAFVMDDNAIMNGADLDMICVFRSANLGDTFQAMLAKSNATSNRYEWITRLQDNDNFQFLASDTGTGTFGVNASGAIGAGAVENTWYAARCTYDESTGDVDVEFYDATQVMDQINAGGGLTEIVANLTPTSSFSDTNTPITMHNDTAKLCVGAFTSGASDDGATQEWMGSIRYAQITFDGGTVTFDPNRDAHTGVESFVDSTSGLTWSLQTVTSQTDWPTIDGVELDFDGGDFAPTNYTPTFTATTGELTIAALITPGAGNTFGAIASSESQLSDGFRLRHTGTATAVDFLVGGSSGVVGTADKTVAVGTRYLLAGVVDDGAIRCYLSGDGFGADASITSVGTITHLPIEIGARADNDGNAWTGSLEAFVIIERALTEAELQALDAYFGV